MSQVFSLSMSTSIALHSVMFLAGKKGPVSSVQLAKTVGYSKFYIAKILEKLVKADILISKRGPQGGYLLNPKGKNKSLLHVYEIIDGKMHREECPLLSEDQENVCALNQIISILQTTFREFLSDYKVGEHKFDPARVKRIIAKSTLMQV